MAPAAPGVFVFYSAALPSEREAAVLEAGKSWFVMPDALAAEYGLPGNCRAGGVSATSLCAEPARPGDSIQILVTGLGKASPNGDSSQATLGTAQVITSGSPLYSPVHQPSVTIGNIPATVSAAVVVPVSFDGRNYYYAGLYRIDVQIPTGITASDFNFVPIVVSTPNLLRDATTTIAIHP
jgi:uncharacterized protein (TIGR03437 family)